MLLFKQLSKHANLLIVIFAATLLALNYPNATVVRKNAGQPGTIIDTDKFSIALPQGWEHHTQVSNGFKIMFLMAPKVDNFSPNLNILNENTGGASVDEYAKASMENMKNANMKIDGAAADFIASGTKGKCFTSTFDYQGRTIALKSYLFIKDGVGYVLTGSCLVPQTETYRPIFDAAVKTFKLK